MTTTPQSMSDLPELPEPANPGYHTGSGYYTADQLREYGRLCRANAEQAGKVEGLRTLWQEMQDAADFADADGGAIRRLADRLESIIDRSESTPLDEGIASIESYAVALDRMAMCNPRTADDFNLSQAAKLIRDYADLLAKPTQPAASIPEFVPPICRDAACAASGTQHDYCTPDAAPVSPSREVEALVAPTERGWYWHHDGEAWRMLFVFPRPGHSYLAVQDYAHPVTGKRHFRMADKIGGRWVGPLETPTLATVQEKAP